MPYGLYLSADGANVQSKRLEVLSNNLANVDTNGFKRQLAIFQARASEAQKLGLDAPGSMTINDLSGGVGFRGTMTDFSVGPFKHTGDSNDVAIAGDGFFRVSKDGQTFLTRSGSLQFNSAGEMLTQEGHKVLDDGGVPIRVTPNGGPVEIGTDGGVSQFDEAGVRLSVSQIGIVQVESPQQLVREGENLYTLPADARSALVPPALRRLQVGFLEASTVNPTSEMTTLIEASRALEANVNMIRNHDQTLGTLVNRVLRQS
jgi:flagellar basal-body rod protein FlgF